MFFGSYLVSQGFISEEIAINAAIEQVKSCPSFISIVRELALLSAEKILIILDKCELEKLSFSTICKRDGYLSDADFNKVLEHLSLKSKNFSKILIENYKVDEKLLKDHFDKFKNPSLTATQDKTSFSEGQISEAALESLKELGAIAPEELAELESKVKQNKVDTSEGFNYSDHFSQKNYNKMIKIIDMTRSSAEAGSDISNTLNSLYQELLMLRERANEAKARISEKLMATIQYLLEEIFRQDNKKLVSWALLNLETLKEGINLIWELRNIMCETGSELAFWSTESSKMRYTNNIKRIREISQF